MSARWATREIPVILVKSVKTFAAVFRTNRSDEKQFRFRCRKAQVTAVASPIGSIQGKARTAIQVTRGEFRIGLARNYRQFLSLIFDDLCSLGDNPKRLCRVTNQCLSGLSQTKNLQFKALFRY
jgi:hypothetical protein